MNCSSYQSAVVSGCHAIRDARVKNLGKFYNILRYMFHLRVEVPCVIVLKGGCSLLAVKQKLFPIF